MKPCTLWYRNDLFKGWVFNHLEDGHATTKKPKPKFENQRGWKNATWERYHRVLTDTKPPRVVDMPVDEEATA